MATRESQGLQIALIIFVIITAALAALTFAFYSTAERLKKELADARTAAKKAQDNFSIENFKVQYLTYILGAAEGVSEADFNVVKQSVLADEEMKKIDDLYQQHMATYGEGLEADQLNYRNLLPNLLQALRARNVDNLNLSEQVAQLEQGKQQLQQSEAQRTQQALDGLAKSQNDLADRTREFEKSRGDLAATQEAQLASFKKQTGAFQAQLASLQQQIEQRDSDMKRMQVVVEQQRDKIRDMQEEPFEVADGQVTWVNQRTRTAWINLGSADGLRRQTLFSVYGLEENGVTRAERKASIEVTRVLSDHLAEARIVSDEPSDPILPGDQVFSPAWRPGQRVHFALVGKLDVDGDGRGDRELVRNLIHASGAEIDAEVTEAGEVIGSVSSTTRYLVRGERPTEKTDPKVLAAYSDVIRDAEQMGVEIITVDKLLSWMGYKREVHTIPLGEAARSADFSLGPEGGRAPTSTGNVSDVFRERTPPTRSSSDSAF